MHSLVAGCDPSPSAGVSKRSRKTSNKFFFRLKNYWELCFCHSLIGNTFPGLLLSPSLGNALRDWVRRFTGEVERGCSGTTPGRKLMDRKRTISLYISFKKNFIQASACFFVLVIYRLEQLPIYSITPLSICILDRKLIYFKGWEPSHCFTCSDRDQRWSAFVPICFVLALSSSAQIRARMQKISLSLTFCVGTQHWKKMTVNAGSDSFITALTDGQCGVCASIQPFKCLHQQNRNETNKHRGTALTGHLHHSRFRCQVFPSPHLPSPSLEEAHQTKGEAWMGDFSLQWEVPLQAPVTALPPPDNLKKHNAQRKEQR